MLNFFYGQTGKRSKTHTIYCKVLITLQLGILQRAKKIPLPFAWVGWHYSLLIGKD